MLSVASTHTEPKSSAIIAATGEKCGLEGPFDFGFGKELLAPLFLRFHAFRMDLQPPNQPVGDVGPQTPGCRVEVQRLGYGGRPYRFAVGSPGGTGSASIHSNASGGTVRHV